VDADRTDLRRLSRQAFGQAYRLELMLAVARQPDGLVSLSELATSLGVAPSNLQIPLKSLVETGLISELPKGDSRRKFYLRNDSAAWAWAQELHDQVTGIDAFDSQN
jgi:DNA-binding IclR family transcriptional regulator